MPDDLVKMPIINDHEALCRTFRQLIGPLAREYGHSDDDFLSFLETMGFFLAPSSRDWHLNIIGGLVLHSLNVHMAVRDLVALANINVDDVPPCAGPADFARFNRGLNALSFCALLHDLCKCRMYYPGYKWFKADTPGAKWEKKPTWVIDDRFPLGHGEKSLYLLTQHFTLSEEMAAAVRWHMGPFDPSAMDGLTKFSYQAAVAKYPMVSILFAADYIATHVLERDYVAKETVLVKAGPAFYDVTRD